MPPPTFAVARLIYKILELYHVEKATQSEIAERLNLSLSKVNRLIAEGRKVGIVRPQITRPFPELFALENALVERTSLARALVTPSPGGDRTTVLAEVTRAAGAYLAETARSGDVIAVSAGRTMVALATNVGGYRPIDVTVVPLCGSTQSAEHGDANRIAESIASKLGGRSRRFLAPLVVPNREDRIALMGTTPVREALDRARSARIALVGIGSVMTADASYHGLRAMLLKDRISLQRSGMRSQIAGYLLLEDGTVAEIDLNEAVIGLRPDELSTCDEVIGVACGPDKVEPIQVALSGNHIDMLVTDGATAARLLSD